MGQNSQANELQRFKHLEANYGTFAQTLLQEQMCGCYTVKAEARVQSGTVKAQFWNSLYNFFSQDRGWDKSGKQYAKRIKSRVRKQILHCSIYLKNRK